MQLLQALAGDIFSEGVLQVLLREEDVYALEGIVVGRHAVILERGYGLHPLLFHILLRKHDCQFFGAVAAEIEEDDDVAFTDAAVDLAVDERLHELVGVLVLLRMGVVTRLYAFHHVGHSAALAVYQQVVGQFDAVPMLVAVHGVVTPDDGRDSTRARLLHVFLQVSDESLS